MLKAKKLAFRCDEFTELNGIDEAISRPKPAPSPALG